MKIFRYLAGDVLNHTGAVALVLFLVVFSGRFIKYLAEAAVGELSADILLPVMVYKLPSFFELILPLSLFIGILLALGRLYADSEMVVLKACGIGQWRIASYLTLPMIAVALLVALLSLTLAPQGSLRALTLLDDPNATSGLQSLSAGRFRVERAGTLVTYAEEVDDAGIMRNVFIAERDVNNSALTTVTRAEEGEIKRDSASGRRYLELRRGSRYTGRGGHAEFERVQFERYGELLPEAEGGLRSSTRSQAIPTEELLASDDPRLKATLYWRLSLPLLVPISALMAIALSRTDARRGRYARLGPALLLFLAYFVALTQGRGAAEAGDGGMGLLGVHASFIGIAVLLMQWEALRIRLSRRSHEPS